MSLYYSCRDHKQEWDEIHIILQTSWYGFGEKVRLAVHKAFYGSKKNTITDLETNCS